ncbi:CBM96 family carbohydrate-binding protein [Dyadobacter flavalbus]|nr:malectin domain-containing carbohydrate-binding protein [Dyadobacter flavalbus]
MAQPAFQWDKTFGGAQDDNLSSIRQTPDGGYIAIGDSKSAQSGDKSQASYGGYEDIWIVKMAADGTKQWDLTLGGDRGDSNGYIELTPDGGYIVGATSTSGVGPIKSQPPYGTDYEEMYDYWIIKLSASGTVEWDKTIGGPKREFLQSLKPTTDGGYILAGVSRSPIGNDKTKAPFNSYLFDHWIVKLSSSGKVQWDTVLRRPQDYDFNSTNTTIELTSDGGYIVGGSQGSEQPDQGDYYLAKLNQNGVVQWEKNYGGADYDELRSVLQTNDGGYLLSGWSISDIGGDKSEASYPFSDYWIVKVDANGNKLWDNTISAGLITDPINNSSRLWSVSKTSDGGFLLGGSSYGREGRDKTEPSRNPEIPVEQFYLARNDYWVVKIAANGKKIWDKTIGGPSNDELRSIAVTMDGGIILGGVSYSPKGYEKSEDGRGGTDFWIVKLAPEPLDKTSIRINAGGAAFTAFGERKFSADQYYQGIDRTSTVATGDILNTADDVLYRSGRCSPSFSYNIPVDNGKVNVILHFAEIWFKEAGERQFNVTMENSRKLTNFDIFSAAGGAMRAVQKSIPVTVTDGVLNIDFTSGAADLPRISAIEVIRTSSTLQPLADAYVRNGSYNATNLGFAPNLDVKSNAADLSSKRSSYLRFQLPQAAITSAKLRIYGHNHENSQDISVHAYGVDDDLWTENGIASSNAPAASTPSLGYVAVNSEYKYHEIDVTNYVKAQQQASETLVSLLLADPNNRNTRVVFNSKENSSYPPQLIVQTPPVVISNTRLSQQELLTETEVQEKQESAIYPNPVKDKFTVSLSMQHAGQISFELISQSGKSYAVPANKSASAGEKAEVNISGLTLSTGIYLLQIKSDAFTEVVKMLITE